MAEGTHVSPFGTPYPQGVFCGGDLIQQVQGLNGNGPGLPLHLLAPPGQLVELLPPHLDGGEHGWHLEDLPPKGGQSGLHLCPTGGDRSGLQHRPGPILGIGDDPQFYIRNIFLIGLAGKLHRPGGPAHKDGEHPCGHGVQGPGVADALFVEGPPQLGADVHAGPLGGLVDDKNTVSRHAAPSGWPLRSPA